MADKNILIRGKAQTPVENLNEKWMRGLQFRQKFETVWTRAYNQLISKAEKTATGFSYYSLGLTASQVRAFTSQLFLNTSGDIPYVELDPDKKDAFPIGMEDIEGLKNSEALIYHAMAKGTGGYLRELLNLIQMVLIYGLGFVKHTYECFYRDVESPMPVYDESGILKCYDYTKRIPARLKIHEGIYYSCRSPFRVVINPNAYNFAPGRTGWVIDSERSVPIERLMGLQKMNRIYNVDKIKESGWVDCFQYRNTAPEDRQLNNADVTKEGLVFIREVWDEIQNEFVVVANWDVEIFRSKMPLLGGIPITGFSLYNLPMEVFSMGIPEQMKYVHTLADTWASLHVDEMSLRVFAPTFVRTGLGLRSKIQKFQPHDIIEVSGDPRMAAYPLERPSHQGELFASIAAFEDFGRKRTGLSQIIEGGAPQSNVTATASVGASMAQQSYLSFLTMLFSMDIGQMATHNLLTLHQFMPVEGISVRDIADTSGVPQSRDITYDKLALNVMPRIKSENRSASRQEQMNTFLALFDRSMPFMQGSIDPKTFAVTPGVMNAKAVLQRMWKIAQFPGWQELFTEGVQQEQLPPQLMQMIQQMQGQGGMASAEQPQPVPAGQQFGNALGQTASAANPGSNNFGNLPNVNRLAGIYQ